MMKLRQSSLDPEEEKVRPKKDHDGNEETRPFMDESSTDDDESAQSNDNESTYSDISSLASQPRKKRGESDEDMLQKTKHGSVPLYGKYSTIPSATLYEHTSIDSMTASNLPITPDSPMHYQWDPHNNDQSTSLGSTTCMLRYK